MKYIYPDLKTIPSDAETMAVHAVVEGSLADIWYNHVNDSFPEKILQKDIDSFSFDAGGMFKQGEKELKFKHSNWTLSVTLRHADILYKYCQKIQSKLDWLGPHIYLPGHWTKIILTVETGQLIKEWLNSEYDEDEAEWEWFKLYEEVEGIKGLYMPPRKENL